MEKQKKRKQMTNNLIVYKEFGHIKGRKAQIWAYWIFHSAMALGEITSTHPPKIIDIHTKHANIPLESKTI